MEENKIKDIIYLNKHLTEKYHELDNWNCETTSGKIVVDHLVVCPGFGSVSKFPH